MSGTGWTQPPPTSTSSSSARKSLGHFRSFSSMAVTSISRPRTPSLTPSHTPTKSASIHHPSRPSGDNPRDFSDEMSTLPDPRSRAMSPAEDSAATPNRHPELNDEVAALSTKLINAINNQTLLDDSLSNAQHELENAKGTIRSLEAQVASHKEMMHGDVWIRRSTVESEKRVMQGKVMEERNKRLEMEREKKKIEQELENLTTALFEEANKMVIKAKEEAKAEHEALQRKNDQLKSQLADSEGLLKSQQEQLVELKNVMEHMASERDDQSNNTAPSSPGLVKSDIRDDDRILSEGPTQSPWAPSVEPSHPTSFPYLFHPVLRTDLSSYDDFTMLARLSRNRASSRVSSGSLGAFNALGLGLGGSTSSAHPSNASTSSLTASVPNANSAPQSPNTPASTISASSNASMTPIPNLKDTRFYKRVLAEDIEPTLRLDVAPGLSWLARRTVINSMCEGSLVVEPVPATSRSFLTTKPQYYPCSLCGEARKHAEYLRNHRFRTSEADSAQRYPLCKYCLTRVRSTCDFLGFLRMVKDGHWRAENEDHEKAAWEESVKLRDQMFWSRIGGGVIPASQMIIPTDLDKSSRDSHEQSSMLEELNANTDGVSDATSPIETETIKRDRKTPIQEPHTPPEQTEGFQTLRNSAQSLDVKSIKSNADSSDTKRLSITIPTTEQKND